jgi:hypothetical protein
MITAYLAVAVLCLVGFAGVMAHGDRLEKIETKRQAALAEERRIAQLRGRHRFEVQP